MCLLSFVLSVCSTCLQCLHLFQRIHLLPQPLKLGPHIISICSCTSTKEARNEETGKRSIGAECVTVVAVGVVNVYLRTVGVTQPFWCEMGGWSWSGARRGKERGRREGPDVPCLRPVDPTGHSATQWHNLYCCESNQHHCRQLNIYTGPLYAFSAYSPCIGSSSVCFCPNIRRRWGRYKGGVANNDFLVSGFW